MKTSDKLLLIFFLVSLAVFGAVHLALYAEYKHGDILSVKDLHEQEFLKYRMPAPQYLSLKGTLWVNIIPSDSFYIEFPAVETHPEEGFFVKTRPGAEPKREQRFRLAGDTLLIAGENEATIHRPFVEFPYRLIVPEVNVYCRGLREIRILNGQIALRGTGGAGGAGGNGGAGGAGGNGGAGGTSGGLPVTSRLVLKNSTLWIGNYKNSLEYTSPEERFDSLDIESRNSIVVLNAPSIIRSLHVRLDDSSELNDQHASVGKPEINYSPDSRINLTGVNLKKAKIIPCN